LVAVFGGVEVGVVGVDKVLFGVAVAGDAGAGGFVGFAVVEGREVEEGAEVAVFGVMAEAGVEFDGDLGFAPCGGRAERGGERGAFGARGGIADAGVVDVVCFDLGTFLPFHLPGKFGNDDRIGAGFERDFVIAGVFAADAGAEERFGFDKEGGGDFYAAESGREEGVLENAVGVVEEDDGGIFFAAGSGKGSEEWRIKN